MSTALEETKNLFRKDDDRAEAPCLPVDVAVERRLPTTERGKRAYHNIKTAYERYFSADEYWEMHADESVTYFGTPNKHLKRYPRDSRLFWPVFYIIIANGMKEVINKTTIYLVVWDAGYAFVANHSTYVTINGTVWTGMVLTRMKFDENGQVYDQAFFTEDVPGLDALTGEVMDLPQVQEKVLLELGIKL
ncbi:hypothetical protein M427DRAFT_155449 [Gonapodya prolifera JEL478]|uniref:SnoaL-like domain-containing protein n=1 Tax=Gonapodya prolifera (strain JEL478) TaxID=1344416 RepID=A0A139AEU1_GONPJ|nr:hypothetical protein M427DRAFT_155449 [Gonapodya prolifera JEL478]|eukprot:KXS15270.1 hypothetical protein M427DRAFT_155449 [Gonapodya prolifera JEL478]